MKSYLNTTLRNVAWFKKTHELNELDVKPPFQRNPVWVTRQKSFLIDTILNGYPIPEIYMQESVNEKGETKYIIVDGQQRIRAVLDFIYGKFAMDAKDSPDFADMDFDDLTVEQKQTVFQHNFVVRILPDIPDVELRAIFQRLNKNVVALNKQELRQATYWGSFIKTMNKISDKEIWSKFELFTANDIRRMLDVEYISELTIAIMHGHQNKKQNLEKYYEIYEEEFDQVQEINEIFDIVLGELIKILPDISSTRWSKKSDFYSLFHVLADNKDKLPLAKDERDKTREILLRFAEEIDLYVKTNKEEDEESTDFTETVKTYIKGIRATTDLNARKNRYLGIEKELTDILSTGANTQ